MNIEMSMKMGCTSNLKNAVIAFLAPLPSIIFYLSFINNATDHPFCYRHPLLLVNLLFFFNVNILFWLIALIQSSHWVGIYPYIFFLLLITMIDIYIFMLCR